MKICAVIGAGGFGREVLPLARAWMQRWEDLGSHGDAELVFVVEDQYFQKDRVLNGHRVLSMSQFIEAPASERRYTIAIGDSKTRERISRQIPSDVAQPISIYAPTHVSLDSNEVGDGAIFCNFTHVTSNAKIGRFFHCNIYSYVAHDCVIGDYVTFAPGVKCNGHVVVEDHAYIGTGAVIRDGTDKPIVIGRGAMIGMGAVVTKSVLPFTTVVGNPARPM
jgi:sugar O-acyltransferase (sialic acid O-acetyltransferase NeuD family)